MILSMLPSTALNTLFVLIYGLVFIYFPGFWLISKLKLTKLETASLSLITGFSLFSLIIYLARSFGLPFFAAEVILIVPFVNMWKKAALPKPSKLTPQITLFIFIAIITALIQSSVLARSAVKTADGLSFVNLSFHDSMQHLSIISRLQASSNIQHPGFSGASLTNYHYLIDTSLTAITRFNFISIFDVYYRIYPIAISLIMSLAIFSFTRRLTKSNSTALLALLLTTFAGNASFFAQFIRGDEFTWSANAFLINPIVDILQNPASIFVLAQMLTVTHLLSIYETSSNRQKYSSLVALTIVAGTMISFKAWGGLLIIGGLALASAWHFLKTKDPKIFYSWAASLGISLVLFLPNYNSSTAASPVWQPGWSLRTMVNDQDRWNYLQDIFLEDHYILKNNVPRIIMLYSKWATIYIVGNYWTRLIGFFAILGLTKKLFKLKSVEALILSVFSASIIFPLLFNQGRMAYDIEQFSPYAIVMASIFTSIVLIKLSKFVSKKTNHQFTGPIFVAIFFLLSIPSNYTSIKARLFGESTIITNQELETYQQISKATKSSDTVMLFPSHRNIATLEFAAMTNRNTFYSGRTLSVITGEDHQARNQSQKDFFSKANQKQQRELINNHKITHLFLYQEDEQYFQPTDDNATKVISSPAGSLYQFN